MKNPFNPNLSKTVSLRPEDVDAIVFWTRNPIPLMGSLRELDQRGFHAIFLYTITGYGPPLEPFSPSLLSALESFRGLSRKIGPEKVIWRFDPIVYVREKEADWILSHFKRIAQSLRGFTRRVMISFLDFYPKVQRRLSRLASEDGGCVLDIVDFPDKIKEISLDLVDIASRHSMEIYSCAEPLALEPFGIRPGKCIDGDLLNRLFGLSLTVKKDKNQRRQCGCMVSQDIGTYNTCGHGCVYCYATEVRNLAPRTNKPKTKSCCLH